MAACASTFRLSFIWVCLLLALPATASTRAVLVGSGDCKDGELLAHLRSLSSALKGRMSERLLDEDAVRERLRPQSQRSVDELKRQMDAARMQFYQADFKKSEAGASAVRADAVRLPPGADRFRLWAESELLLALVYRDTQRVALSDESFRRVLRVQPDFELNADFFSPSTRQLFEKYRREVAGAKRGTLEVRSSPAGADVFLEGVLMGKTPFTRELPVGTYALAVVKAERASLPRQIVLAGQMQLHIDLAFEGAIQPTRVTCLSDSGDEAVRLLNAVKLATLLDVDEVVLLRVERPSSGPEWLAASLVNVQTAQKVREGGLKLTGGGATEDALAELATFVVTGERTTRVQTPPETVADSTAPVVSADAPSITGSPDSVQPAWKRPASYGLGAVGVASVGSGVFFLVQSLNARSEFDSYKLSNGSIDPERRFEAAAARDRADTNQALAFVTLGLGAAAIGGAAYLFATSADAPAVSVLPTNGGAAVTFSSAF